MKLTSFSSFTGGCAVSLFALSIATTSAQVTVDGVRDGGEYSGGVVTNQATVSNWNDATDQGDGNKHEALANLHAVQDGNDLAIHMAARFQDRAIILFIDSRSGGRTFIPDNLITFGGEGEFINNLGSSDSNGLTFENGFEADYAIRIYGDGGTGAFVNFYDLKAGIREFVGNAGVEDVDYGPIRLMRADGLGTTTIANDTTSYAAADHGLEMKLDLAALGVPSGSQTVKLMALLVINDSTYASNQVLASKTSNADDIGTSINSFDFQAEPGTQTVSVPVSAPSSREVVFSVDMDGETAKGFFNAASDRVKVLFFGGVASPVPGEIYLTDEDSDGTYTGSIMATGSESDPFGAYKFYNTSGIANLGFEYGNDRNFTLGPVDVPQNLPEVAFRGNSYGLWADLFASGQAGNEDFEGDGIKNIIEYFMGTSASEFTPNPAPVGGLVTWPRDPFAVGVNFKVWKSETLAAGSWVDVTGDCDTTDPNSLKYTLPSADKVFIRLEVSE